MAYQSIKNEQPKRDCKFYNKGICNHKDSPQPGHNRCCKSLCEVYEAQICPDIPKCQDAQKCKEGILNFCTY